MTPAQLQRHRLEADAIAARTMVTICAVLMRPTLPAPTSPERERLFDAVRQLLADAERANASLVIPGAHPAVSNLLADQWHDAFRQAGEHLLQELAK